MRSPIYFNGKFYGGGMNGVHRVSDRLIRECDTRLADLPRTQRPRAVLFAPENSAWVPRLEAIEVHRVAGTGQLWEQASLPRLAGDGVLVNLANLAPIAHRRKVVMIHDAQFLFRDCGYPLRQRLGYRALVPLIARTSKRILTVSEFSRRTLDTLGVARSSQTTVIPNGSDHILDTQPYSGWPAEFGLEAMTYVVMFGSPKAYKNNQVVFEAFAGRAIAPIRLAVVGPQRTELEAAGLTAPEDAVFVGKPDDAQLRALLEGALAIAFPSRTEGFGLPPLEAMQCGCPAVVSPAGAIPEACGDAVIYAGTDRPQEWRDAFLVLRDNSDLWRYKSELGKARAERFTWAESGQRLMDAIAAI